MGTHPEIDKALEGLAHQLRDAAGSNLLGIALYGGLAKGRYTPGVSDVNVLVVLADAALPALLPLAPILTAALRDTHIVPFVVTPADLRAAAVLFPVKILDIQLSHRLLWGDVYLAGIEVEPEPLRLRTLQELKNMELRMRLRVVERGGDTDALWRGLLRNLPKLAVTLEVLLRARGIKEVPADRRGVLLQAAQQLGVAAETIEPLAGLRRSDHRPEPEGVRQLLASYLDLLAELCRRLEDEIG
jgi:predicted nucleotidyltransferase